jgi:hypothetical protein
LIVKNAWDEPRRQVVKNGRGTYFDNGRDIKVNGRDWVVPSSPYTCSQELRNGIPHGIRTIWEDGVLSSTTEFVKGEPHGIQTIFYDNGRVQHKVRLEHGEERGTQTFPRFDNLRPAVILEVEANAKLYSTWGDPLLDTYPTVRNLDKVSARLKIPAFLQEVFERIKASELSGDDDDLDAFDDSTSYRVTINLTRSVEDVQWISASSYSRDMVDFYQKIVKQLRFEPGTVDGLDTPHS